MRLLIIMKVSGKANTNTMKIIQNQKIIMFTMVAPAITWTIWKMDTVVDLILAAPILAAL